MYNHTDIMVDIDSLSAILGVAAGAALAYGPKLISVLRTDENKVLTPRKLDQMLLSHKSDDDEWRGTKIFTLKKEARINVASEELEAISTRLEDIRLREDDVASRVKEMVKGFRRLKSKVEGIEEQGTQMLEAKAGFAPLFEEKKAIFQLLHQALSAKTQVNNELAFWECVKGGSTQQATLKILLERPQLPEDKLDHFLAGETGGAYDDHEWNDIYRIWFQ